MAKIFIHVFLHKKTHNLLCKRKIVLEISFLLIPFKHHGGHRHWIPTNHHPYHHHYVNRPIHQKNLHSRCKKINTHTHRSSSCRSVLELRLVSHLGPKRRQPRQAMIKKAGLSLLLYLWQEWQVSPFPSHSWAAQRSGIKTGYVP